MLSSNVASSDYKVQHSSKAAITVKGTRWGCYKTPMHSSDVDSSDYEHRGFQVRNQISLKIRRVWSLLHVKSYLVAKRPPCWCGTEVWRGSANSGVVLVI
ncbi:hypothetical protein AVEN_99876-1 [Araneus ventricosus]|uniref:Uncharacterized protein n=1 Tax=Araneus ventricosus TaxID=182803 RepID=A0A4Y2J912_ARAVE|nr:hypothetical protein AVEN_99876-1 [Araneus ventricosus]